MLSARPCTRWMILAASMVSHGLGWRPWRFVWVALVLVMGAGGIRAQGEGIRKPLVFGVLNQQSVLQTAERWNPILQYLTQKTGIPLQLRMGATMEQTDAMLGREEFDLAFTNHNFQREYDGKYQVIARWAGPPVHGVIVVREESRFQQLSEIAGQAVAFPSSEAFLGYAVTQVALRQAGVTVAEKFAGTQYGALAQLAANKVEAASVNSRFLEDYQRREKARYRKIFVSESFFEQPVIAHPRLAPSVVASLRQAMVDMKKDPLAVSLLAKVECPGFEPANDADYENMRRVYRAIGE